MTVPKYDDFFNPLLRAMHELGGSATIAEQEDKVAAILNLSDKDLSEIHRGSRLRQLTRKLSNAKSAEPSALTLRRRMLRKRPRKFRGKRNYSAY